jgi:hypothetical protein
MQFVWQQYLSKTQLLCVCVCVCVCVCNDGVITKHTLGQVAALGRQRQQGYFKGVAEAPNRDKGGSSYPSGKGLQAQPRLSPAQHQTMGSLPASLKDS